MCLCSQHCSPYVMYFFPLAPSMTLFFFCLQKFEYSLFSCGFLFIYSAQAFLSFMVLCTAFFYFGKLSSIITSNISFISFFLSSPQIPITQMLECSVLSHSFQMFYSTFYLFFNVSLWKFLLICSLLSFSALSCLLSSLLKDFVKDITCKRRWRSKEIMFMPKRRYAPSAFKALVQEINIVYYVIDLSLLLVSLGSLYYRFHLF